MTSADHLHFCKASVDLAAKQQEDRRKAMAGAVQEVVWTLDNVQLDRILAIINENEGKNGNH